MVFLDALKHRRSVTLSTLDVHAGEARCLRKTAVVRGTSIPQSLLLRIDEAIE